MRSGDLNGREKASEGLGLCKVSRKLQVWLPQRFPCVKETRRLPSCLRPRVGVTGGTYGPWEGDGVETTGTACPAQFQRRFGFILSWLARGKSSAWPHRADGDEMQMAARRRWWRWSSSSCYLLLDRQKRNSQPQRKNI